MEHDSRNKTDHRAWAFLSIVLSLEPLQAFLFDRSDLLTDPGAAIVRWRRAAEESMLMKLTLNGHASRIASVADLRRNLAPFASQQFREIWLRMDAGGPLLGALMNTNVGLLAYLRHDEGDTGFSSRNPLCDESDALGGLAFNGLY